MVIINHGVTITIAKIDSGDLIALETTVQVTELPAKAGDFSVGFEHTTSKRNLHDIKG